jgi:hypothetical protein
MTARRAVLVITIALAGLMVAPVVAADDRDGDRHGHKGDFVPVHRLAGSTGGELLREWWETVLPIPAATNPITPGAPELCFNIGRRGKVATFATVNETATCTIKAGQRLFVPGIPVECSSAEPPPFFGATEEEQRACVEDFMAGPTVVAIRLSLDGGEPQDVRNERFEVITPQGETVFPEDPIFDATPGPATFVGGDWSSTLRRKLRPGQHTIAIEIQLVDQTFNTLLTLNVVRGHDHD